MTDEAEKLRAENEELRRRLEQTESAYKNCRKALVFWGLVLGYEPGRQLNHLVYWTMGDRRTAMPPALVALAKASGGPYRARRLRETMRQTLAALGDSEPIGSLDKAVGALRRTVGVDLSPASSAP